MEYYIVQDGQEAGPFDMMSLVRKVKNGSLTTTTLVRTPNSAAIPAGTMPELASLFDTAAEIAAAPPAPSADPSAIQYDVKRVFQNGWEFLQINQPAVIYSGVFMVATAFISLILGRLPFIGYVTAFAASYVAYGAYMHIMLKLSRGHSVNISDSIKLATSQAVPLALAALVMSIPVGLGIILLIAPGLLVITLYLFVPFLIVERRMHFWAAMETSRKKVMSMGSNNFGVLFALVVANFMASLLLMIPLLITLPVTANALTDIYDQQFGE